MILYELKLLVDKEWLDVLDVISRHQEGFMWSEIDAVEYVEVNE